MEYESPEKVFDFFQRLADRIARSEPIDLILETALQKVCEASGGIFSQIWQVDRQKKSIECVPIWYPNEEKFRPFRKVSEILRLTPGEELPGRAFLLKCAVWIENLSREKNFSRIDAADACGLKAAFAVPILAAESVLAVTEFFLPEPFRADKKLMNLMAAYASSFSLILQKSETELALKQREKEYQILFESNPNPMWVYDRRTLAILAVNDAAVAHYGFSREDFFSMTVNEFLAENTGEEQKPSWFRTSRHRKKDGSVMEVEVTLRDLTFNSRPATLVLVNDITERRRAEEMIRYQVQHDTLTDLPNRLLFQDRLEVSLARANRSQDMCAVLFLDLDRFKNINNSLGHDTGDKLLQHVAMKLKSQLREADTVSRFGGDEFVILLPSIAKIQDAARVAQKILNLIEQPWSINERELYITASIGVVVFPYDGKDAQTLLRNADTAMYRAKEQGRNNYQLYTQAMNVKATEYFKLENSLRQAIEKREFVLHYQPQVEIATGRMIGMEALVRWEHPDLGLLSPDRFIFLAEETGLIVSLGEWVLRTACAQNKKWIDSGFPPLHVSVNLASRQFQQKKLIELVKSALRETGLSPHCLGLEITESAAMENADFTIQILREFNRMGIELSIDDFGTGYSSLSYLKRFPIHRLKIDKTFVRDLADDPNDAAIATSVILLARNLGIKTMAEGVETKRQLDFLLERGCEEAQGFLYSKPLPPLQFEELLKGMQSQNNGNELVFKNLS